MHALVLSLFMLLADAPAPADLNGKVVAPDGNPIGGATVMVYSASPKKGAPTIAPQEHPDCQKSAVTDSSGAFTIPGADSSMQYELLVLSDTYRPLMLKKVDPLKGAITAKVKSIPADTAPELIVKGRIVDTKGDPIAGAKVEPCSYGSGNSRTFGGESSVIETLTYTNTKGEFTLIAKQAGYDFYMLIRSKNAAPMIAQHLLAGQESQDFTMTPGAKIIGRVVKDGVGLAGLKLMLVQTDRNSETFLDIDSTYTNSEGKFSFGHAHPNTAYGLTVTTRSLAGRGGVAGINCRTEGDDTVCEAGDLAVEAGNTLSGQLVASAGKTSFSDAKVRIELADTWDDALEIAADKDGKFAFSGILPGPHELTVKLDQFHLSKDNASAEPYGARFLLGRIDENISDLKVQLDPGPAEQGGGYSQGAWEALRSTRLSGVESK